MSLFTGDYDAPNTWTFASGNGNQIVVTFTVNNPSLSQGGPGPHPAVIATDVVVDAILNALLDVPDMDLSAGQMTRAFPDAETIYLPL